MTKSSDYRTGRHCVFNMHIHLVFITKYRKAVFTKSDVDELRSIFTGICESFESALVEMDGERDHVHLLIHYPPKVAVSKLVNSLKGASSRVMRKKNERLRRIYWNGVLWSPSYFAASCGGAPIEIVRQYIEQQATPH
ncbi:MAG: IS200/IS605 family transposase [Ghiorsea sp.]|nr:IS200/IS605 family transposase [Ghiorsea sp.]